MSRSPDMSASKSPGSLLPAVVLLAALQWGPPPAPAAEANLRIVPVGDLVYRLVATSDTATRGGETLLTYDGRLLRLLAVEPGPALPAGSGIFRADLDPEDHCPL